MKSRPTRATIINNFLTLPELYIFFVAPLLVVSVALAFPRFNLAANLRSMAGNKGPLFFFFMGPLVLKLLLLGLLFYVPLKALSLLTPGSRKTVTPLAVVLSGLFVYGGVVLGNLGNVLLLSYINKTAVAPVEAASFQLLHWDNYLFGGYPAFEIQSVIPESFGSFCLSIYALYSSVYIVTFVTMIALDLAAFRRFNLAWLIWVILSTPLWVHFPAISPEEMFRRNILGVSELDLGIMSATASIHIPPPLDSFLKQLEVIWSRPKDGVFAITCFPSFHLGGVFILCYAWYQIHRRTLLLSIPFLLCTAIGALYAMQHYLVDFIPAIINGFLSIILAEWLISLRDEKADASRYFSAIQLFQSDIRKLLGAGLSFGGRSSSPRW